MTGQRIGGRRRLGRAVEALVAERAASAAQIGEVAGIAAIKMAAIVDGDHDIRLPVLVDLATALDVRAASLAMAYALPRDAPLPAFPPRRPEGRFDAIEAAGRLGRAIRLARLLRGLGRREISETTAVARDEVRRLEDGLTSSPSLSGIHSLAAALTDDLDEAAALLRALIALYADDESTLRRVVALTPSAP